MHPMFSVRINDTAETNILYLLLVTDFFRFQFLVRLDNDYTQFIMSIIGAVAMIIQ